MKPKFVFAALLAGLGFFTVVLFVSADEGAGNTHEVTDALGRTVSFKTIPERIVLAGKAVLFSVNAMYLFPEAAGRVVGVGVTDQGLGDFYPFLDFDYRNKARFANNVGPEQIAGIRPDLVILKTYMRKSLGDSLDSIGIPVLYIDLESSTRFYEDVFMLGDLLRAPERADSIVKYYKSRVESISLAVKDVNRPTVLILSYNEHDGEIAFNVPAENWIQTFMVETAGGAPVWRNTVFGQGWIKINFEQISVWDPDYVFVVSYRTPAGKAVQSLKQSSLWKTLRAVEEGHIVPFPADYSSWDQPDVRWILGLQWIALKLHPELLPDLDMRREIVSFYTDLYGIEASVIQNDILTRIGTVPEGE